MSPSRTHLILQLLPLDQQLLLSSMERYKVHSRRISFNSQLSSQGVFLSFLYARYPELLKPGMWFGLALAAGSLFLSSFVSRVRTFRHCGYRRLSQRHRQVELLILLQGIGLGIGSGMLYWPAMFLISEWFSQKRGLASGIVFAGSGIGGEYH